MIRAMPVVASMTAATESNNKAISISSRFFGRRQARHIGPESITFPSSFEEFVQLVSRSGERMPDDLLVGL
jgi:hypothetical protein